MAPNILSQLRALDKEQLFEPFLEDNFREFTAGVWLNGVNEPLSDAWVIENCRISGLDDTAQSLLLDLATKVREDDDLKFLYFHCSRLRCSLNKLYRKSVESWPDISPLLKGSKESLFFLLLGLHAVDHIIEMHKTQNIPYDITLDTCTDLASRVEISKTFNDGEIGISRTCINWFTSNFIIGNLFKIGRMQFHLMQFEQPFLIYRHKTRPLYKIIAEHGLRVNDEGLLDGAGFKLSPTAWTTQFVRDNETITAHVIDDQTGVISKETETFSLNEWDLVVRRGSQVMNIHIPRGPGITTDIWLDSIKQAFNFFETIYTPNTIVDACVCFSWMFEPRLRNMLTEKSRLIQLQDVVHLFPLACNETTFGLYFIFGTDDLKKAKPDNSLRRSVLEHYKKGGILTGGSMIIFKDELDKN